MSKVDLTDINNWPDDAEANIDNKFMKWCEGNEYRLEDDGWKKSSIPWSLEKFSGTKSFRVVMRPDEWKKGEERMEPIVQNGNDGEHYAELENNKSKYHREIKKGVLVDVYDVLSAFEVINPAMQHALKKMLAPGKRGAKDAIQDMKEAIQSIERAIELEQEKG